MAIITASVAVDPLPVRAVQNVLVPFVGLRDGRPDDDGESRFDDHLFNAFCPSIEDRPATVVNKIGASTRSDTIDGRCDILQHRLIGWSRSGVLKLVPLNEKDTRQKSCFAWLHPYYTCAAGCCERT
jgi:hypothetical protein